MNKIVEILMNRDGMSESEATLMLEEARQRFNDGEDPEEILEYDFGLEPDYVFDLMGM
jgi:hypothetical protein